MFSILIKQNSASAQLVRRNQTPYLLATFHASTPPMIWQMDLERTANFTVSLRESEGEWDIGYTPSENDFIAVAHFDERGDAEKAYAVVQKALSRNVGPSSGTGALTKFLAFVAVAALLFVVLSAGAAFVKGLRVSEAVPSAALSDNAKQKTYSVGEIPTGQPVAADDVLPQQP